MREVVGEDLWDYLEMRAGGWENERCYGCSTERAGGLDMGEQTYQWGFHKEALSKVWILVSHQEEILNIQNR